MERALPPTMKVHKDAAIIVRDMITEFIGFSTCEAVDRLTEDRRQSLTAEDGMYLATSH